MAPLAPMNPLPLQVPALTGCLDSVLESAAGPQRESTPVQWMHEDCITVTQIMEKDTESQSHQLSGLELEVGWRRTGRKFGKRIGMIRKGRESVP